MRQYFIYPNIRMIVLLYMYTGVIVVDETIKYVFLTLKQDKFLLVTVLS